MLRWILGLVVNLFCFQLVSAVQSSIDEVYVGSRESDPASIVENVSTIHGDYTEVEIDLIVPAPDPLVLSRFYSSQDTLQTATLGGWRFNPHCFLTIRKDSKVKSHTAMEEKLEYVQVFVGNPEGSILTYSGWQNTASSQDRFLFKIDTEENALGLANTARGDINKRTNLKNNELYFDSRMSTFELILSSGGKRFYVKHPSMEIYLLKYEILPSGNKIFYDFDVQGRLSLIKETNASERKELAWIRLQYDEAIHIDTSDGKTADYYFQRDGFGSDLLTEVIRSDKPNLYYQYQIRDGRALLLKKELPEGRFVEVDYYPDKENNYKVKTVTTPTGITQFFYGEDDTQVYDTLNHKTLYRLNEDLLIAVEQYLDGSLYRVQRKAWGKKRDATNLISTSVEDGSGNIFYYKFFTYDNNGNVVKECEYGNLTGADSRPLSFDEEGNPNGEGHVKTYSYFSGKTTDGFFQKDEKGTGVKFWYKRGTNLLVKKCVLRKGSPNKEEEDEDSGIKKRYFYEYNEDAVLVRAVVDDGCDFDPNYTYDVNERLITIISPKQELPNIGAPEIIEEKFLDSKGKTEVLLKKTIHQFDSQGNSVSQAVYDAKGEYRYSITKAYQQGLLLLEADPLGNETHYSYDANHNLVLERHSASGTAIEYGYDLSNRLIRKMEKDACGNCFESRISYDPAGNKISGVDRFGNETVYVNDDLGRPIQITYPEINDGPHSSIRPVYVYAYDLLDNLISVTDPKGRITSKSYSVRGQPTNIHYLDGTQELFKYDLEGSLHRYCGRDGIIQVFEYDYLGRLNHIEYYKRKSNGSEEGFKRKYYTHNAFHLVSELDEMENKTTYTYDRAGRLVTLNKENQKIEFIYDALGRTQGIKKWKSPTTFTLHVKEFDLLDRVIEERIEDTHGKVLVKSRYVYNDAGQLEQVIGYPQNHKSILAQYEYDGFGRLRKITNASKHVTEVLYEDNYVNERGQRGQRRTLIGPVGNRTEEIYDILGNLIKVTKKDQDGNLLAETESSYDFSGNKVLERAAVISEGHPLKTYETQWSFGKTDQLQSATLSKGTSEERSLSFEYSTYGEVIAKHYPGSNPVTYHYTPRGNLRTVSYKEGKESIEHLLAYDLNRNITKIILASSQTLSYSYDVNNLLISETINDEFGSYQVNLTYNGERKIRTIKLPDKSLIEYTYEGPFVKSVARFSKKKELYQYQVTSRDQMGHSLEEVLPGYVGGRKQAWDEAGRRTEISTDFFQDKIPEGGYDQFENIKKRETLLDDEKLIRDYDYNALCQLISEKGEIEHTYVYDSLGNRLQKDGTTYEVNEANQLIEAQSASYSFNPNGNLATKTIADKTWTYHWNPLNQLVSIRDPDQNTITFSYDLSGRRLTKCIEAKGKKRKVFRYFYLGQMEIGCLNEKGEIVELKVPADPNNPEASPCIAIELKKEIYIPLFDLQGNIVCLLDHQKRKIVESYYYSVFGEEEIINENGRKVSDSAVGNPWRYQGKRVEKEIGLIYFGLRYYDPEVGRWISPDPAGDIDGPNLYCFARNNPMTYIDYFGLAAEMNENQSKEFLGYFYGEYEPHCYCEVHRNCKRGGDIASAVAGISHGVADFMIGSLHDLQTATAYIGSAELGMSLNERTRMIQAIEQSQANQMASVEDWIMNMLSMDQSDAVYQSFRSKTTLGLEIGSLVIGGYGAVKGVMSFGKIGRMPIQLAKLITKKGVVLSRGAENVNAAVNLNRKLTQLQDIQKIAVRTRILPDGRVRYYQAERLSRINGPTRGSSYVTEYNPLTGEIRGWNECYDQLGMVNRVHPKNINGQQLVSPHYPPTSMELNL